MAGPFRPGAIGALMDEYERAAADLLRALDRIPAETFDAVLRPDEPDEDCRSIRTVMRHVVGAGYGYATLIRSALGAPVDRPDPGNPSGDEAPAALRGMLEFTVETLDGRWEMTAAEAEALVIETSWGGRYPIEQLLEHAIVHVLRHRRQIERFLAESQEGAA